MEIVMGQSPRALVLIASHGCVQRVFATRHYGRCLSFFLVFSTVTDPQGEPEQCVQKAYTTSYC